MLKFLTHKLRTHSINENPYPDQVDEDHDSGTESDDEIDPQELIAPVVMMDGMERMCSVSPADTGCSMESPIPSLILSTPSMDAHDPHSSEEELEVINSTSYSPIQSLGLVCNGNGTGGRPLLPLIHHHHRMSSSPPAAVVPTSSAAEKRKWSEVGDLSSGGSYGGLIRYSSPENEENMSHYGNLSPVESPPCCAVGRYYGEELGVLPRGASVFEHSGSSDDEVHNLLSTPPLQFRTSPPLEALKPHHPPPCHSMQSITNTAAAPYINGRRTPHTTANKIVLRSAAAATVDARATAGSPPPAKVLAQQQLIDDGGASRYYYCGGYSNEVAAATVAASPRKRRKDGLRERLQGNNRPYLDFEKMQQLKTHSVTWRSGEQKRGGELSLCVW